MWFKKGAKYRWRPIGLIALIGWAAWTLSATAPPALAQDEGPSTPQSTHRIFLPVVTRTQSAGRISALQSNTTAVARYGKFEVAFQINTPADNYYFPYDPAAPINQSGVSVDMLITSPSGSVKTVPCFYYQPVDANVLPVGRADWRCRFTPNATGTWRYAIRLVDQAGTSQSESNTFNVTASSNHGFVRVSPTDSRYFEFDDGTPFLAPLVNVETGNPLNSLAQIRANIPKWGTNGVRFVRWFPTGEGANFFVIPFGDEVKVSWGFGPAGNKTDSNPGTGDRFTFAPYYYTGQNIKAAPGGRYRLSFRARVTGDKVFRPQLGNAVLEIRAADWRTYTLETTITGGDLMVWLHDGYSESEVRSGTIRVDDAMVQRDETGQGGWGPNLLARGDAETYRLVDQIGAARLDEIMRLSEQYGVYHKLTLFHKNDPVLGIMAANGALTGWDINNFYSGEGQVVRWLEKAYARYFVARWGYSTALHSVELGNENMLTANSYDAAFSVLGYMRSLEPRHLLLSNSFWGYFVEPFWTDAPRGSLLDYADKHWYARPDSRDGELVSTLYTDSAGNVRECQRRFKEYRTWYSFNKPIVRGETGLWVSGTNDQLSLGSGAATYYHKQLWAQMGDQCAGEWYIQYMIDNNLWSQYKLYESFWQGEPLANGHYADVGTDTGSITAANVSGSVRAWGKVDATNGRGTVWIDNANDTWQRVANGQSIGTTSATLSLNTPNGTYQITWFNTETGTTTTSSQSVSNGKLTLTVSALAHDVAVKFRKQ